MSDLYYKMFPHEMAAFAMLPPEQRQSTLTNMRARCIAALRAWQPPAYEQGTPDMLVASFQTAYITRPDDNARMFYMLGVLSVYEVAYA